jgi:hypothetical protein
MLADGTLPESALQARVQQDRIFVVEEWRVVAPLKTGFPRPEGDRRQLAARPLCPTNPSDLTRQHRQGPRHSITQSQLRHSPRHSTSRRHTSELVTVVSRTMEPTRVWLWVRQPGEVLDQWRMLVFHARSTKLVEAGYP